LIVFIRSNPVASDPRVEKEVKSLTSDGFRVVVLAWDREGTHRNYEFCNGWIVYRLKLRAAYHKLAVVAYYPIFWLWVLSKLIKMHPNIVHACDLDSILPALLYRRVVGHTKVIFDVFDNYALLIQARSKVLGSIVGSIESFFASTPDAFVTVSEERLKLFDKAKLPLTEIIMNCPPDHYLENHKQIKKNPRAFRIVYAGIIASDRGLVELAEATKGIENVEIIIAGRVVEPDIAESLFSFSHVKYVGQLSFDESLALEKSADVIPVLYDLQVPINEIATPNKLFEAMMIGVPIITNLDRFLQEVNCGISVDYGSIAEIRNAILCLKKHPAARRELGLQGRSAFEKKYNWSVMERKLITLYHQLLTS
jgi:glycosyltransferase involved in cell wall biosynthesis